jgi:hypothetical protein
MDDSDNDIDLEESLSKIRGEPERDVSNQMISPPNGRSRLPDDDTDDLTFYTLSHKGGGNKIVAEKMNDHNLGGDPVLHLEREGQTRALVYEDFMVVDGDVPKQPLRDNYDALIEKHGDIPVGVAGVIPVDEGKVQDWINTALESGLHEESTEAHGDHNSTYDRFRINSEEESGEAVWADRQGSMATSGRTGGPPEGYQQVYDQATDIKDERAATLIENL